MTHTKDEIMKLAIEALELMYACYAHPEWISHKQQEEKILAQCAATTMTLRQALAKQEQGEPVVKESFTTEQEQPTVNQFNPDYDGVAMMYEEMKVMAKRIEELEALAKQEQGEPVGVAHLMQEGFTHCIWSEAVVPVGTKFYTAPQQRPLRSDIKPLTDEQIEEIAERTLFPINFARAIEHAHGIKE